MNLSLSTKFWAAVGLQVVIVLGVAFVQFSVVQSGTEVWLKIAPVDPRSPLRGDYVTFRYDVSTLNNVPGTETLRPGSRVYVTLEQRGKFWEATRVGATPPAQGIFLRGVSFGGQSVVYGIEQYFIPEGSGRTLPFGREQEIFAKVAVDQSGNAVVKEIFINDRRWPE